MFCTQCGFQLPDNSKFCAKCGAPLGVTSTTSQAPPAQGSPVSGIAASPPSPVQQTGQGVAQLKCPGCGAPINPKFGEMVITCEYCGTSVFMGAGGWKNVQKHTMLPLLLVDKEQLLSKSKNILDSGFLHHHRFEKSKLVDMTLDVVPYWLIPSSASTTVTYLWGETSSGTTVIGGGQGGPTFIPSGGGRPEYKTEVVDEVYDFPVVAVRAMKDCQPIEFQFSLDQRTLFDASKFSKSIKVLNGDVGEEEAENHAKALVDKLQYQKAHERHKHHTISKIETKVDVGEGELLHVPIWRMKFNHEGKDILLVLDGSSGGVISSSGL